MFDVTLEAEIVAPFAPVLQVYVFAPEAVKVAVAPIQTESFAIIIFGKGFVVIVNVTFLLPQDVVAVRV